MIHSTVALLAIAGSAGANTVNDDGQDAVARGIASAKTYTVTNKGSDPEITAVAYNLAGQVVGWITIGNGSSKDIGVPAGGTLIVDDRKHTGSQESPTIVNDGDALGSGDTYGS